MPGTVFGVNNGTEALFGFAGKYARQSKYIIHTRTLAGTSPVLFGRPLILTDNPVGAVRSDVGAVIQADATTNEDNFVGFAAFRTKVNTTGSLFNQSQDGPGGGYIPYEAVDVFEEGSISVLVDEGTPVVNGNCWIRTVTAGDGTDIGNICATEPTEGGFLLPNAKFNTKMDENNIAELRLFNQINV